MNSDGSVRPVAPQDGHAGLVNILVLALEELVATGQADAACRLAGRACATLRKKGLQRLAAIQHIAASSEHIGMTTEVEQIGTKPPA